MAGREKGVATAPCGACGTDLPIEVEQPDGSVTTDECPKCNKKVEPEQASTPGVGRETGTSVSGKDA